jgi:serine/threonine protein kinase/Tol biopolymer transport system component
MALPPGSRLGPYDVTAKIGVGGMGEVYRARDTRLHRDVALKILPAELTRDAARHARFVQEARAASALAHPHIAVVHDIGETDGVTFIAMELVRGEPLSDLVARTSLAPERAVDLAIEIAEALAHAHDVGLVHRDLKPANVMVTTEGHAKIIDFGLAKLVDVLGGESRETVTRQVTESGMVLGTVSYMSPEQAEGAPVDHRSDVFSFGIVLYEMLAGRRPFAGRTTIDTLHAILNTPAPPLPDVLGPVLADLQRIVDKCLVKAPSERYQGMRDTVVDLRTARRRLASLPIGLEASTTPGPTRSTRNHWETLRPRRAWVYVVAAIALAAVATIAAVLRMPRTSLVPPTEWEPITDYADSVTSPALSADGRMLAFLRGPRTLTTTGDVYVMVLPKGPTLQLTHDESQEKGDPVFSPDGSTVAYMTPFQTWTVPIGGGKPQLWLQNAASLRWMDGNTLLFSEMAGSGSPRGMAVATSDASRTRERVVYTPAGPVGMAHRSYASPDRKWVLVAAEMERRPPWVWQPCRVVPFDGSSSGRTVGPSGAACTSAAWSPDGRWIYLVTNAGGAFHVWRQRFPDGAPEQLTAGPTEEEGIAVMPDGKSLVTAVGSRRISLVLHDGAAERAIVSDGRPRIARAENGSPFSHDGKTLYYLQVARGSNDVGDAMLTSYTSGELWNVDLASGQAAAVFPGLNVTRFSLARDGNRIAFTTAENEGPRLWVATLDRKSPPRQLPVTAPEVPRFANEYIYYAAREPAAPAGVPRSILHRIRADGTGDERIWTKDFWRWAVSPTGRHLALTLRGFAGGGGDVIGTEIVDWQTGNAIPVCKDCSGWWSDDGSWFIIARQSRAGDQLGLYLLPTSGDTELPEVPAGGFAALADAAHAKGARIIDQAGDVGVSGSPGRYAFVREIVHRNLFRIPLR